MKYINSSSLCPFCGQPVDLSEVQIPLIKEAVLPAEILGAKVHFRCAVASREANLIRQAFLLAGGEEGPRLNGGWVKSFSGLGFASLTPFELHVFSPQLLLILPIPRSQSATLLQGLNTHMSLIDMPGLSLNLSLPNAVEIRFCPHKWRPTEAPEDKVHIVYRTEVEPNELGDFIKLLSAALSTLQETNMAALNKPHSS